MKFLCLRCKGRGFCGRRLCALQLNINSLFKIKDFAKKDFFGSSPAPFVGRFGYPHVNVGILSPPDREENAWVYDAPGYWAKSNFSLQALASLRSSLINSRFKANVKSSHRFLNLTQEISMSSKPVDVEINLKKKPKLNLEIDHITTPMGPRASLIRARATENPKISPKVEKVVSDFDLKAAEALHYLHEKDFDETFLTRLLSTANLGLKKNRKLVPTRWSITAVDDTIAKHLLRQVSDFKEVDYSFYFGSYLENNYLILFFPGVWGYELFEMVVPDRPSSTFEFMTDYEFHSGRKYYAENCAGGYYAVRLAVLEKLKRLKRKGSVIVLRFIDKGYSLPLGVWVCKEAARKALVSKPLFFGSRELLLKYVKDFVHKKFGLDITFLLKESVLLKEMKTQTKLSYFYPS